MVQNLLIFLLSSQDHLQTKSNCSQYSSEGLVVCSYQDKIVTPHELVRSNKIKGKGSLTSRKTLQTNEKILSKMLSELVTSGIKFTDADNISSQEINKLAQIFPTYFKK